MAAARNFTRWAGILGAAAMLCFTGFSAYGQGKHQLKVGMPVGIPTEWAVYVGIDKGFYAKENLEVELVMFGNPGDITPALTSGRIDVGVGPYSAPMFARVQKVPMVMIVAGQSTRGEYNNWYAVLPNSKINTVKDLKGATVNSVNAVFLTHILATEYIARQGVNLADVKFIGVNFPESYATLKTGRADMAAFIEPFYSMANKASMQEYGKPLRVIFTYKDAMGIDVIVLSTPGLVMQDSLTGKADALRSYVRGTLAASRWGAQQENRAAVNEVIVKRTQIPADIVATMLLPPNSLDGLFPPTQLRLTQELLIKAGLLKASAPFPDDQLFDRRFIQ